MVDRFSARMSRFKGAVLAVAMVAVVSALSGCGSSGSDEAIANSLQPEGNWTAVRWVKSRSDTGTVGAGQALDRRYVLTPTCATGKCDIKVTPGGLNGTVYPEGETAPDTKKSSEFVYRWDASKSKYTYADGPTMNSCTTKEGGVVDDAYEATSSGEMAFVAATKAKAASMTGTVTSVVKGVGDGIAAGCTDYTVVYNFAAAPTDAVASNDRVDYSGKYVVTEVVESTTPAGARSPGFAGVLVASSEVARTTDGFTIGGVATKPAPLTLNASGWEGSISDSAICTLNEGGTVADAYTLNEKWSQLRVPAFTASGKPVLTGRWQSDYVPTAAGNASQCAGSQNRGYVILVPLGD